MRVDGEDYEKLVRERFGSTCPYCSRELTPTDSVIEHLDGMNRYRVGLHVPGNVLVACKRCNSEKRRDDSLQALLLGPTGWESFLSHDGTRCVAACHTCEYWKEVWPDEIERKHRLTSNLSRIRAFRGSFSEFQLLLPDFVKSHPSLLAKLYSDCQIFAEKEIRTLLEQLYPAKS
jgi:hypothetical protein